MKSGGQTGLGDYPEGPFKLGKPTGPTASKGSMAPMQSSSDLAAMKREAVSKAMATPEPSPEAQPEPAAPDSTPAPTPKKTETYSAEGDPYTYQLHDDGSVTIQSGPSGEGMTLTTGPAYQAIMGQITSGQLKPAGGTPQATLDGRDVDPMGGTTPEERMKLGWSEQPTEDFLARKK